MAHPFPVRQTREHGTLPINRAPFDVFTLAHAGAGAILGAMGLTSGQVTAVAIAWELVEYPLKELAPGLFRRWDSPALDSPANAVVDAAAMVVGHWLVTASTRR